MDEVEKLIQQLEEGDLDTRMRAALLLGEKKDARAVPALIEALGDENLVALVAALALRNIGDPSAKTGLIEALKGDHSVVWMRAAEALGDLGDVSVVPVLVEGLKNKSIYMGMGASNALVKIGAPAVPALIEALKVGDRYVQKDVVDTLEKIVEKCGTIEEIEKVEKGIDEGSVALRKGRVDKGSLIDVQIKLAKLTRKIAEKKDELAPKRDLLLDGKPKPPKKGRGVYQVSKRVRNG